MGPSFGDPSAPEVRDTQYFEMFCNRGIYHKGWTAVTRHSVPWDMSVAMPELDDDVWELYAPDDWTQAHDISGEQPEMLHELQRLFLIEATKYNVLPLDDRRAERFNPDLAGRPQLVRGNRQLLFGGMKRLSENSIVAMKNKSYAVTAEIDVPAEGAKGVIAAQGGAFGGWSLYAKDGRPAYCYNLFGLQRFKVYGDEPLAEGEHQVRLEFAYERGGLGKGGTASLYVDGNTVGEGQVEATVPMLFSSDETLDIGSDSGTPVTDDLTVDELEFNGRVRWVEIDLGEDAEDADHLITPDERLKIAMARQ
jgi:arylsulfatase